MYVSNTSRVTATPRHEPAYSTQCPQSTEIVALALITNIVTAAAANSTYCFGCLFNYQ